MKLNVSSRGNAYSNRFSLNSDTLQLFCMCVPLVFICWRQKINARVFFPSGICCSCRAARPRSPTDQYVAVVPTAPTRTLRTHPSSRNPHTSEGARMSARVLRWNGSSEFRCSPSCCFLDFHSAS
jgi:hypothetical protein